MLAACSGVALFLAFPRASIFPLAWVALVPLLIALRRARTGEAFLLGLVTGIVFFASLLYWITLFGYLPWVLLALMQGLFVAIFAVFARRMYRRGWLALIAVPAAWTAIEWLRSLGMFGFTWGGLAYSQARWTDIIQIASITGPWGVTFLIVIVNTAIAGLVTGSRRRSLYGVAVVGLVVLGVWAWGAVSVRQNQNAGRMRVAVVQGNVEMTWRDDDTLSRIAQTYWPMTEGLGRSADFIVWPESALPGDLLSSPALRQQMARLAKRAGAYMLVGGPHVAPDGKAVDGYREYNGAYLVSPEGQVVDHYFKVHLVPFGEFVPGRDWLPLVHNYRIREVDYSPGSGFKTLKSRRGELGVMICFESIFPQISRKLAQDGAEILFVITNDSWFGRTAAAAQHHDFSILRAVESRRFVVRNATTGVSSLIAPSGEVLASAGLGKKAVVRGTIGRSQVMTVYTKYGDWFAVLCLVIGIIGLYIPTGHPR